MNDEKVNRYFNRTLEHIHRVQKNMFTIITKYHDRFQMSLEDRRLAAYSVLNHDRSKFNTTQCGAYIELTEYYHQRKALGNKDYEYPSIDIKEQVDSAVINHYHNENHHLERHAGYISGFTGLEMIETICDLQAMAQEFGEGSCRGYFDNVWLPKYKINSPDMVTFAYRVIECFEKELED